VTCDIDLKIWVRTYNKEHGGHWGHW